MDTGFGGVPGLARLHLLVSSSLPSCTTSAPCISSLEPTQSSVTIPLPSYPTLTHLFLHSTGPCLGRSFECQPG